MGTDRTAFCMESIRLLTKKLTRHKQPHQLLTLPGTGQLARCQTLPGQMKQRMSVPLNSLSAYSI